MGTEEVPLLSIQDSPPVSASDTASLNWRGPNSSERCNSRTMMVTSPPTERLSPRREPPIWIESLPPSSRTRGRESEHTWLQSIYEVLRVDWRIYPVLPVDVRGDVD